MDALIYWMGLIGVAVGALAGVLEARRKEMDLVGAVFVGMATALGGGTLRDLLLTRSVFWVLDQTYLMVALLTSAISFFVLLQRALPERLLLVPDAVVLALFTVLGTQAAAQVGAPWLVASLMGMTTGVAGGVLRDIFCNQVPLVFLKGELYASAAWTGALLLIALQFAGFSEVLAAWCGMLLVLGLRLAAIIFHITLPAFAGNKSSS